jgi:hypothetical protein
MLVLPAGWAPSAVAAVALAGVATASVTVMGASHDARSASAAWSGRITAVGAAAPAWVDHGSTLSACATTGAWVDHGSAQSVVVARRAVSLIDV